MGCVLKDLRGLHVDILEAELVDKCRNSQQMKQLWKEFRDHVFESKRQAKAVHHAACAEICLKTWIVEQEVRVHFHAFYANPAAKMYIPSMRPFSFMSSDAVSKNDKNSTSRMVHRGSDSGDYYIQVQKRGSLFHIADRTPFEDYAVNPSWVSTLLSGRKITREQAEGEFAKCVRCFSANWSNLKALSNWEHDIYIRQLELTAQARLGSQLKPSIVLDQVEAWKASFVDLKFRYKFIVLEGPSRFGKSLFASSVAGFGSTLDCNCAGTLHPDLRGMDNRVHRAVHFEEASAKLVLSYKRHFQSPPVRLSTGSSATNCHTYYVWLHQVMLIITSNTWTQELVHLLEADRDWLFMNSVHIRVESNLWVDDEDDLAPPDASEIAFDDIPAELNMPICHNDPEAEDYEYDPWADHVH